jgi:Xaa-Pro aminopeptidase
LLKIKLMNSNNAKLNSLRRLIEAKGIDMYIIPSTDPHLGEYVADHWRIVEWLTGFTGSAATLVITDSFAGLLTDSRYIIQAEKQLSGSGFVLMKSSSGERNDLSGWIDENIKPGGRIALDGRIISIERIRNIEKSLEGKEVSFDYDCDLISELWTDRPPIPISQGFEHDVKYCGRERSFKIAEVREKMRMIGLNYSLLTAPEDIMWLLNIRGNDIRYSPLLISFSIVGEEQVLLFIEESKIPLKLASEFDRLGIVMLPYEETEGIISTLESGSAILLNPASTSRSLFKAIPAGMKITEDISIPTRLKAIKNSVEIENIGTAMIKDGVALTRFFHWLENETGTGDLTELSLAEKLNNFRSMNENYLGPSFSTIVAWNENGALPHYTPDSVSNAVIGEKGIILIDSGGQYLDGTTDITRTIAVGLSTARQKKDFSLVLKGNINLALAKFPLGTKGYHLDILAREALWENGLNYGHGTGHGVGFCLNVHEGPQNIGQSSGSNSKTTIEPGMVISNEPAIYREGEYGIRIENLLLCYENEETEFGKFLKFDTLSLCYIDKNLIDISLLEKREIDWLNNYHSEVYEKLSPFLNAEEKKWLKLKTSAI